MKVAERLDECFGDECLAMSRCFLILNVLDLDVECMDSLRV